MIETRPVLDFTALEPGRAATEAIRTAASDLNLARDYRARVRLTGPVAMADEEFGTAAGGRAGERYRHHPDGAADPVVRAALGPHHRCGVSHICSSVLR